MRRKPIPAPVITKTKPRPRTTSEHVLTVAEFYDTNASSRERAVKPMIRMRGAWLEEIGFHAGEYVIVTAEPKRLVLTIAEES